MSPTDARPFALVPRRRFVGVRFGGYRSPRRGKGDEVAGTRAYRPGDRRTWIDWRASARLSAARGADEFVVREFFADNAPRVVVAVDRQPRMALYGRSFPWLDKPAAIAAALRSIGRATAAEGGDLAYVEQRGGRPLWLSPRAPAHILEVVVDAGDDLRAGSERGSFEASLDTLLRRSATFPVGTFAFVVSDFVEPIPARQWVGLRARGWDVTPVVVQDPTWEQSFPEVGGVLLPVSDPGSGEIVEVWIGRREARARAAANEARLDRLVGGFRRLGFDPVVLGTSNPTEIAAEFGNWADRRRRLRRRSA